MVQKKPGKNKKDVVIELNLQPKWEHVANVRTFVEKFLNINYGANEKSNTIAFTVSELIENSIKYSDKGNIRFVLKFDSDMKAVITIENLAKPKNIEKLRKEIRHLNRVSRENAYDNKLKSAFRKKEVTDGLGLAMIRERTGGKFSLRVEGSKVKVKYNLEFN